MMIRKNIRSVVPKSIYLAALALVCFATSALADVTMKLTGPPPGPSMGGIYTAPYTATINGVSTFVICDDFYTDVSVNTPAWNATVTKVSDLTGPVASSAVKFFQPVSDPSGQYPFTNATGAEQQKAYTTAAYLAVQIMSVAQTSSYEAGLLSYALWGLFDPAAFTWLTNHDGVANADLGKLAQDRLTAAQAATAGQNTSYYSQVSIYTPSPVKGVSQEYLVVSMAEPPSLAVLSLDLLAVAGLVFFVRRRRTVNC